ncbi:MAG TPA: DUF790 family protein, partial [Candidatus Hodarchaeales archaeon]|nr:DUF790 family protein [Candidatus Hodarchaeales archaeon]
MGSTADMEILYRSGTRNGRLIPLFLSIKDQETLDIIGELISTFESSINKPASNFIDEAYYLERFSEVKLFLNIVEVLTRHFYSISTLESSGESQPWDLREKLFSYLTEQNYSFVGPKDHEIILKELAVAKSLNVDELKEDLFADHSIFTKLTRREGENSIPLPNDVVETYNLESFYALVRRSFWMQFELERISADVSFI